MENLNEVTLSFATLISPAFIAYLVFRKLLNKSIYENINIALVISLVTFNFIIIGFVQINLAILDIIIQILIYFFSEQNTLIILKSIQALILLYIFKTYIPENRESTFFKNILLHHKKFFALVTMFHTLVLAEDINLVRNLFDNEKFLIALNKIQANPFAITLNTSIGVILLLALKKFFDSFKVPKLNNKECDFMYPSKFLQTNSIISKSLKEISLTKFPEIRISFTTNLENTYCYEYELTFDSKDITHIFLNKEFSLFQFIIKLDKNDRINYYTIKNLIKAVFYNNKKLKALIEYYLSGSDRYNDIEPVVEDENIEIYISDDDNFIINLKLCNKDILRYIR